MTSKLTLDILRKITIGTPQTKKNKKWKKILICLCLENRTSTYLPGMICSYSLNYRTKEEEHSREREKERKILFVNKYLQNILSFL